MERVAFLHSLGLLDMEPDCEEAKSIQSLVDLAGAFLKADLVVVSFQTQEYEHRRFLRFPSGRWPDPQAVPVQVERVKAICNYTLATPNSQCFVVHDVSKDQSLACFWYEKAGIGFYSAAPIVIQGIKVGTLCIANREANNKFGRVQELQQEQFAELISQQYETWALNREVQRLERERNLFLNPTASTSHSRAPPTDYAALVFTSVQGITDLRKAHPDAISQATELHNGIVSSNIAECNGYEVSVEDSAFHVAFADVVDAIQFCLKTQEALHVAPWGSDILNIPRLGSAGSFRGLRVKMAIHCGNVESNTHGTLEYSGSTFHIAKNLQSMARGGQILITSDVWNVASHLVSSTLGSPQVVHLGKHVVPSSSSNMQDGITTKSILQLVPASLAHGFHESRRLGGEALAKTSGRVFPCIKTKKSMSASFHDAPFSGNTVVLVYMDTSEVETMVEDTSILLKAFSKRVGALLQEQQPDGYQCNDSLVAFEDMATAIRFGLSVQENLGKEYVLDVSLFDRIRIGVHEGVFDTMGPNPVTGKAEYFGAVVDRVASVAKSACLGSVLMGKKAEDMDEFNLPPISNGYMLKFSERRYVDGIREELSFYKCHPCKSWYDQMVDNKNGRTSLRSPWRGYH